MARKLSFKQNLFVEYYLQSIGEEGFHGLRVGNATKASRLAGYAGNDVTLASVGYENLRKPHIKSEIEKRLDDVVMGSNEVLVRLGQMARGFDMTKYVKLTETFRVREKDGKFYKEFAGYTMKIDIDKLQEDGFSHLIKKIKQTSRGGVDVEWHDQMAALVHIGRHHGSFKDITEWRGKIEYEDVSLTDEERKERVDRLLGAKTEEIS
ncbi:hypothetical protein LCGC14_0914830 [marine sediment metagenome]|uniref:Terminase small subunit n=1 Tax=marine sediment metagenome TaxID=412755 RepID=A0A0F9NXB2_9ZZZZ